MHATIENDGPLGVFLMALRKPTESSAQAEHSLNELAELVLSAGCRVLGKMVQVRQSFHPAFVFGPGKLAELKQCMANAKADAAVFDGQLSPSQGIQIERALGYMTLDRTQVILDIFKRSARSKEAQKQVELAEMEYMLPRLVGMWAHLDRERGGIAGSKGIGEKQIDVDRSLIRQRIGQLRRTLKHLGKVRSVQKKRRNAHCLHAILVGYTNAGKSTLMNRLTGSTQWVENRLFSTLDSKARVLRAHPAPPYLLTDTVGFIGDLPHQLVASFQSTLEVARDADLLLHVVDASREAYETCMAITEETLEQIQATHQPRVLIFNKIDRLEKMQRLLLQKKYPHAVFVSAISGNCRALYKKIMHFFAQSLLEAEVCMAPSADHALHQVHRLCSVQETDWRDGLIYLRVLGMPNHLRRLRAALGSQVTWRFSSTPNGFV